MDSSEMRRSLPSGYAGGAFRIVGVKVSGLLSGQRARQNPMLDRNVSWSMETVLTRSLSHDPHHD